MRIGNTLSLVVFTAVMAAVLGFAYGNVLGAAQGFNIKEWQTAIGVGVALIAVFIAFINVQTTLRMNLISREEDRIERALPGLRAAMRFIGRIAEDLKTLQLEGWTELSLKMLEHHVLGHKLVQTPSEVVTRASMDKALPTADDRTKDQVRQALSEVELQVGMLQGAHAARELQWARHRADPEVPKEREHVQAFIAREAARLNDAINALEALRRDFEVRIGSHERQLSIFRKEIEAFFGD